MRRRFVAAVCMAALLAGCGGGDGGAGGSTAANPGGSATPTPTASTGTCSVLARQQWAGDQLREWYLFPDLLPASLDPTSFATVQDYIDGLTATARGQRKDRYFTYVTSIAEENAFYNSGSSAGFGVRLTYDTAARRVFVSEAFEGAPALAAGIDRGAEILAIGTSSAALQTVASLYEAGGQAAVSEALGPSTAGTTRVLRVAEGGTTREVSVVKADYALTPVSNRYGVKVIEEGGQRYGYVNLRTFIDTADPALRQAFATLKAAGVTQVVVDLRYNGGGALKIAELFGDLLGGGRSTGDVQSRTVYRPSKSDRNTIRAFAPQSQSIAATRIAFIGTGSTASASEVVINAMRPYLGTNAALVGANTYGKPVGQIGIDRTACDDRLRVVALATQNAAAQGEYYDGLAARMERTCQATDDVTYPLGDPREGSTRAALDFLQGKSCTPIAVDATIRSAGRGGRREPLAPQAPTAAQREVPGLF